MALLFFINCSYRTFFFTLITGISIELYFEVFICLTAWLFMLVSYRRSGVNSRNSLLWFFWGALCFVFVITFYLLATAFVDSPSPYIVVVFKIGINFVIISTFFMSIFFAGTFDTGFIIKRTLIDGVLFLLVILVYNTIEHLGMHTINEHLGIGDAFTSSLLSGVLVLILSPLHHKLSSYLGRKLKHGNH